MIIVCLTLAQVTNGLQRVFHTYPSMLLLTVVLYEIVSNDEKYGIYLILEDVTYQMIPF